MKLPADNNTNTNTNTMTSDIRSLIPGALAALGVKPEALEITGSGWDALIAALNRSEKAKLELDAAQKAATDAVHYFLAEGGTLRQVASASADIINRREVAR